MKKILYLLFIGMILIGCKEEKKETPTALFFKDKHYEATIQNEVGTTEVKINVPVIVDENNPVVQVINEHILKEITELISFENDLDETNSYDELIKSFLQAYTDFSQQFPDDDLAWNAKIKASTTFYNANILAIELDYYTFAGGAHGFKGKKSLIYDLKSGKEIDEDDIFSDWDSLSKLLADKLDYYEDLKDNQGKIEYPEDIFILEDTFIMTFINPNNYPFTDKVDEVVFNKSEIDSFIVIDISKKDLPIRQSN
ncbi:PdaC/SigV domain-containing protein [Myroides pelagicus]|uniref:DUF4163 domain-containing protein n=1 Tax=Myroides pelagicus TaxID=270914 RepID=A0A7K1GJD9_9FLAO|nr:DUF4163 domain-containing protein [Myroides pelagicus]MTH28908.1 DUF4163 domain-containing protein [Myroides pelagicus]